MALSLLLICSCALCSAEEPRVDSGNHEQPPSIGFAHTMPSPWLAHPGHLTPQVASRFPVDCHRNQRSFFLTFLPEAYQCVIEAQHYVVEVALGSWMALVEAFMYFLVSIGVAPKKARQRKSSLRTDFSGSWQLVDRENMDEFMADMGYNWVTRAAAVRAGQVQVITQDKKHIKIVTQDLRGNSLLCLPLSGRGVVASLPSKLLKRSLCDLYVTVWPPKRPLFDLLGLVLGALVMANDGDDGQRVMRRVKWRGRQLVVEEIYDNQKGVTGTCARSLSPDERKMHVTVTKRTASPTGHMARMTVGFHRIAS